MGARKHYSESLEGSSEPIESLYGQAKKALAVCSWGLCVPQGVSYERGALVWC